MSGSMSAARGARLVKAAHIARKIHSAASLDGRSNLVAAYRLRQ